MFLIQSAVIYKPVYAYLNLESIKHKVSKRVIWDFKNANFEQLRDNLKNEIWNFIDDMDINESTDTFTEKLMNNARLSIPNKECTIKFDDPPWMHNEIRKQIRKRKRLHKIAKRRNTPGDWLTFRRQRNSHQFDKDIKNRLLCETCIKP